MVETDHDEIKKLKKTFTQRIPSLWALSFKEEDIYKSQLPMAVNHQNFGVWQIQKYKPCCSIKIFKKLAIMLNSEGYDEVKILEWSQYLCSDNDFQKYDSKEITWDKKHDTCIGNMQQGKTQKYCPVIWVTMNSQSCRDD